MSFQNNELHFKQREMTRSNDEPVRLLEVDELQPAAASGRDEADDDVLSHEEEQFVTGFVDYWTRRGAQLVSAQA